ncbi:MAG TPA: SIR2 family protein [Polyangiaceae bacterium]|nr:SIR2 family protein [Polyangiaceae bacterium]
MLDVIPEQLRMAARRGELNVLVGAGLSAGAGLPTWLDLLSKLGTALAPKERKAVSRCIEEGRLLDAAQLLRIYLTQRELVEALARHLPADAEPTPVHQAIWALQPGVVMTTNFDGLLEKAYVRAYRDVPNTVIGVAVRTGPVSARNGAIVKLHGSLAEPESIVFSRNDYFRLMGPAVAQFGSVWAEFIYRPCLALGYSFRDPDLQLMFHWLNTSLRGLLQPLYLLVPELPPEELALLRSFECIVPLEYGSVDQATECLLDVLGRLKRERDSSAAPKSATALGVALQRHLNVETKTALHALRGPLASLDLALQTIASPDAATGATAERGLSEAFVALKDATESLERASALLDTAEDHGRSSSCHACFESLRKSLSFHYRRLQLPCDFEPNLEGALPLSPITYALVVGVALDNAVEAALPGQPPEVTIHAHATNLGGRRQLVTEVRDKGKGLDEAMQGRLFAPGATTKGQGRGNGLYLIRLIAENAGGSVTFTSQPGKGSHFRLVLPISPVSSSSTLARPAARAPRQRFTRPITVLVLDDERLYLEQVRRLLVASGCEVVTFASGHEAVTWLRETAKLPEIAVIDLVLQDGLSGFSVGEAARQRRADLPIIFQSGYSSSTADWGPETAFLLKLHDHEELLTEMSRLTSVPLEGRQ